MQRTLTTATAVSGLAVAAVVAFEMLGSRLRSSAERTGLAVLPFENLTADSRQEFFSAGFTAEMISQLGKLEPTRLRVIARSSTTPYKKSSKRIDRIGAELGVDYVLEGSVRRADSRVRLAARLVRVRDQAEVWAQVYERDVRDILSIQVGVARAIADEVTIAFASKATTRSASRLWNPLEVHEAYLKGRYFLEPALDVRRCPYRAATRAAAVARNAAFHRSARVRRSQIRPPRRRDGRSSRLEGEVGEQLRAGRRLRARASTTGSKQLDELEKAYSERDPWLSLSLVQVGLNGIRAEPRFRRSVWCARCRRPSSNTSTTAIWSRTPP